MRYTRNIAVMIILISFLYVFAVTFFPIPTTGTDHSKTIIGFILGTGLNTLINYYWGSSKKKGGEGEEKKD